MDCTVAAGPRGTLRNVSMSFKRGTGGLNGFGARWRVFWIVFGPVEVVAGGVFDESVGVPSLDGLNDFVEFFLTLETYKNGLTGLRDIRKPISRVDHSCNSYT